MPTLEKVAAETRAAQLNVFMYGNPLRLGWCPYMLKFAANDFVWVIHELLILSFDPRIVKTQDGSNRLFTALGQAKALCDRLGLSSAIKQHERIHTTLASRVSGGMVVLPLSDLRELLEELIRRVQEDLSERSFTMMPADKVKYLDELWLDAEPLEASFPNAHEELRNSARCYAFNQEIASVFHSMRALEIGLSALAITLGVTSKKPDWQNLINEIENEIKKINGPHAGTDWKQKEKFYSEAATNFRYFKNAWRNHVMHVRDSYTERDAKRIMEHVTSFLNVLASGGLRE